MVLQGYKAGNSSTLLHYALRTCTYDIKFVINNMSDKFNFAENGSTRGDQKVLKLMLYLRNSTYNLFFLCHFINPFISNILSKFD